MASPFTFAPLSTFIVRTKCEPADEQSNELIIRAFRCDVSEVPAGSGPITVIRADHVQIVVPECFFELEELSAAQSVAMGGAT
jgi:hypothetical protein